jgi:hypothetical protein
MREWYLKPTIICNLFVADEREREKVTMRTVVIWNIQHHSCYLILSIKQEKAMINIMLFTHLNERKKIEYLLCIIIRSIVN